MKLITDNPMLPVNALAPVAYVAVNSWVVAPLPQVPMLGATIVPCSRPPHLPAPPPATCILAPFVALHLRGLWNGIPFTILLVWNNPCDWAGNIPPVRFHVVPVFGVGWRLIITDLIIVVDLYNVTQNTGPTPSGGWPNAGPFANLALVYGP